MMNKKRTLAIIGGGAAGVFCAVNAAAQDPDLEVVVVEKTGKLLAKVKVSGGGRCNVTHDEQDITAMSSRYPRGRHFVRKAFHQFFTTDTLAWFSKRGVKLKTEKDGRMFPVTDKSDTIIQCLLREADHYGVRYRMNTHVLDVRAQGEQFILELEHGQNREELLADAVCLASGGMIKPGQFHWLEALGHTLVKPVPSLFTFNLPGHPLNKLMGVSVPDAEIRIPAMKYKDHGPLLITHWGLSGPVVLKASAWCARDLEAMDYQTAVVINWCHGDHEQSVREKLQRHRESLGAQPVKSRPPLPLPQRLWEHVCEESGVQQQRWADLPAQVLNKLARLITSFEVQISGKTSFKEEFVTAGGVNLAEVDPASMQSKKKQGLYFAGEVLDVDGITGGFNFQHAWTSGWIAARHIGGKSLH